MSMDHGIYMQRCFNLAEKAAGKTGLNPLVGAVLVNNNRIIGEGWHTHYGGPHAEVSALNSVRPGDRYLIEKSTLYVSLEPCSHHGKTPPCADLVVKNRIPRVVAAIRDPYPQVSGRGIEKLKKAGVVVIEGIGKKNAEELNKMFWVNQTKGRCYVTIKFATSRDGFVGKPGNRIPISNDVVNQWVHRLRSCHDAIGVGRITAENDNAQLTARKFPGKNPLRLLFTEKGAVKNDINLFDRSAATCVVAPKRPLNIPSEISFLEAGTNWGDTFGLILSELKIGSVLIEGGPKLIESILREGCWDELIQITGNCILKEGVKAPDISMLVPESEIKMVDNSVLVFRNRRPA